MVHIKSWMQPSYYWDNNWNVHCTFFTNDGKRHDIKCRWNIGKQLYTFRFRNSVWCTNCQRG